jgi:hypothetical protein
VCGIVGYVGPRAASPLLLAGDFPFRGARPCRHHRCFRVRAAAAAGLPLHDSSLVHSPELKTRDRAGAHDRIDRSAGSQADESYGDIGITRRDDDGRSRCRGCNRRRRGHPHERNGDRAVTPQLSRAHDRCCPEAAMGRPRSGRRIWPHTRVLAVTPFRTLQLSGAFASDGRMSGEAAAQARTRRAAEFVPNLNCGGAWPALLRFRRATVS